MMESLLTPALERTGFPSVLPILKRPNRIARLVASDTLLGFREDFIDILFGFGRHALAGAFVVLHQIAGFLEHPVLHGGPALGIPILVTVPVHKRRLVMLAEPLHGVILIQIVAAGPPSADLLDRHSLLVYIKATGDQPAHPDDLVI